MYLYDKFFSDYDKTVAQILLNAEDIENEEKKENLINTFNTLLEMGIIPIVNENDSVSYTEGFYDSDPRLHPDAKLIERISDIDEKVLSLAGGAGSRRGTGGMKTKLQAAKLAAAQGIDTVITNGNNPASLYKIIKGDNVGTIFVGKAMESAIFIPPS